MEKKNFEDYMQDVTRCLLEKDPTVDLVKLATGMRESFPKKPQPRDYFCICYIYRERSNLPMMPKDLEDWGKKIKQAFKHIDDLEPQKRDINRLNLLRMAERVPLESDEIYRMSKKALEEIDKSFVAKDDLLHIKYRAANTYYDELLKKAEDSKNFDDYQKNIKAYEKAYDVLLDTSPGSRYDKYRYFRTKLKSLYMQSEWGRSEWYRRERWMNQKMFKGLPLDVQKAMRWNMNQGK